MQLFLGLMQSVYHPTNNRSNKCFTIVYDSLCIRKIYIFSNITDIKPKDGKVIVWSVMLTKTSKNYTTVLLNLNDECIDTNNIAAPLSLICLWEFQ